MTYPAPKLCAMPAPYHHGDLPAALRAAAAELVAERGTSGFSLRETARRAGVSHAAPAHHFGDLRGLFTSLAAEGFAILNDAMAASADITDARDRLEAIGKAYVRTALRYPGHFAVIFQPDLIDPTNDYCIGVSMGSYGQLLTAIELVRDQLNPALDVETAAVTAWAMMQGLVVLSPKFEMMNDVMGTSPRQLDDLITDMTTLMIDGFRARPA